MGGLALPGDSQDPHAGTRVGVGEGGEGGGLAPPGVGLQQDHAPVAAGQVAHRRALVGAEVWVGGKGLLDVLGGGRHPDVALCRKRQQARLGLEEVGGGVEPPEGRALGEGWLEERRVIGEEVVGEGFEPVGRRPSRMGLGQGAQEIAAAEDALALGEALGPGQGGGDLGAPPLVGKVGAGAAEQAGDLRAPEACSAARARQSAWATSRAITGFRSRVWRWAAPTAARPRAPRAPTSSAISVWRAEKCSRTVRGMPESSAVPFTTGPQATPSARVSAWRITASAIVPAVLAAWKTGRMSGAE